MNGLMDLIMNIKEYKYLIMNSIVNIMGMVLSYSTLCDANDMRYDAFSHISSESFEDDSDRRGSCKDELPYLCFSTSYPSHGGIDVGVEPI